MAAEMIEKLEKEFHQADPEEKEKFMKSSLALLQTVMGDTEKIM
jgi:hypothetical protein